MKKRKKKLKGRKITLIITEARARERRAREVVVTCGAARGKVSTGLSEERPSTDFPLPIFIIIIH